MDIGGVVLSAARLCGLLAITDRRFVVVCFRLAGGGK